MKLVLILMALNCFFVGFGQNSVALKTAPKAASASSISVFLTDLPDSTTVELVDLLDNRKVLASGIAKSNRVAFKLPTPTVSLCVLSFVKLNKEIVIFLDGKQTYEVIGTLASNKVTKSLRQIEYIDFVNNFDPIFKEVQQLNAAYNTNPGKKDSLVELYNTVNDRLQARIDNFTSKYKNSPVATFLLLQTYTLGSEEALKTRFDALGSTAKKNAIGDKLNTILTPASPGVVGSLQPDFTLNDPSDKPVKLSDFRGKYVLLDFWASWCRPCRMENPSVVAAYQKYKSKNFTVLSVSLDQPGQKDAWVNAIAQDGLTWTNVSDLMFWSSPVARLYGVQGIPANFLIDPNGKLLSSNLRGPALDAALETFLKPAKKAPKTAVKKKKK